MKKLLYLIVAFSILTSTPFALIWGVNHRSLYYWQGSAGAYPNGFEQLCPTGSQPIAQGNTWNPSTQRWKANQCIDANGNLSLLVSGTTIFLHINGGVTNPGSLPGTTCGDKIITALATIPSNGVIFDIDHTCGFGTPTSPWTAITTTKYVLLRFAEPGIYWTSGITFSTVAGNFAPGIASIFPCAIKPAVGTQSCGVEIHMGNGLNKPALVQMGSALSVLTDVLLDGNAANNPTGGPNILLTAGSSKIRSVASINAPTHGLWISSTGLLNQACCSSVESSFFGFNQADGIYVSNTGDITYSANPISLGNGTSICAVGCSLTGTVSTTSTLITCSLSYCWSTDSSLANTWVTINNATDCLIQGAPPSTTTLSVSATQCWNFSGVVTALGVQTNVPFVMGSAVELRDSPTQRWNGGETSTSKAHSWMVSGTSTGFGSNRQEIGGQIQSGNDGQEDVKVVGSCTDNQALNCAISNLINIGQFIGSTKRTSSAGTYSFIKLIDGCGNNLGENVFTFSGGANQERALVEQVESASGRACGLPNIVTPNTVNGSGTIANYIDNVLNGTMGMQIPNSCFGNAQLDLFNPKSGAVTPHVFLCLDNSGNLIIKNASLTNSAFFTQAGALSVTTTITGTQGFLSGTFANLPAAANGTSYNCSDCTAGSNPCTGTSTGALAVRQNGVWVCK